MNVFRKLLATVVGLLIACSAAPCLAAGGGGGSTNPLTVDPDLAIFSLIIFVVLLVVLKVFAWGPIMNGLKMREDSIAGEIEAAEQKNQQAQDLLTQYEAHLSSAEDKVREMIEDGRRSADSQKQQILEEAQNAAKAERDRALREIGAAKNSAVNELAQKSVDAAVDLASRIVGEQLAPADHNRLIQETLEKFPSQN